MLARNPSGMGTMMPYMVLYEREDDTPFTSMSFQHRKIFKCEEGKRNASEDNTGTQEKSTEQESTKLGRARKH